MITIKDVELVLQELEWQVIEHVESHPEESYSVIGPKFGVDRKWIQRIMKKHNRALRKRGRIPRWLKEQVSQ